jgi:hypothetical protein
MVRLRVPELFLGCFLTVAVFAAGMLFNWRQSAEPQSVKQHEVGSRGHKTENPDSEFTGMTWLTNDAAGFFTFGLVVIGVGQAMLFLVQLRYMRQGMRDATIAANAADLSARAASAIEFPVVRTNWMGPEMMATDELIQPKAPYAGTVDDGWPTRFSAIGGVEFQNYGRTPAFAVEISLGVSVANQLSEVPTYTYVVRCGPNTVIGARDNKEIEVHFGFELTEEQVGMIEGTEAVLWLYGRLTFRDVMDRPHDIGFCWQWGRQNEADSISYFFDEGNAPVAYTIKT